METHPKIKLPRIPSTIQLNELNLDGIALRWNDFGDSVEKSFSGVLGNDFGEDIVSKWDHYRCFGERAVFVKFHCQNVVYPVGRFWLAIGRLVVVSPSTIFFIFLCEK